MSGSFGLGGSNSESNSNFNQSVWGPQGTALGKMYKRSRKLYDQQINDINAQVPGAVAGQQGVFNTANPAWQNALNGGVYQNMGLQKSLMDSLNQSMNQPTATQEINNMIMGGSGNNYADAMKEQYINDANRAQENMLSNLDSRAAASGMSGGSRHGIATGLGMRDINQNLQRNLAETGFNTFDQDLNRKLQIAQQADQGTLARQGMMSDKLNQMQGTQTGALGMGQNMQGLNMGQFDPYSAPWSAMNSYASTLGNPVVLGQGNSSGNSKGMGASGSYSSMGGFGGGK